MNALEEEIISDNYESYLVQEIRNGATLHIDDDPVGSPGAGYGRDYPHHKIEQWHFSVNPRKYFEDEKAKLLRTKVRFPEVTYLGEECPHGGHWEQPDYSKQELVWKCSSGICSI